MHSGFWTKCGAPHFAPLLLRPLGRSDRGKNRLSNKVNAIIENAIKKIYLKAEQPDVAAVVEEVWLQCFKNKIKNKPHADTIRQRVAALPDRLKLEKRKNRKAAAERYEPIKGHFPGADYRPK